MPPPAMSALRVPLCDFDGNYIRVAAAVVAATSTWPLVFDIERRGMANLRCAVTRDVFAARAARVGDHHVLHLRDTLDPAAAAAAPDVTEAEDADAPVSVFVFDSDFGARRQSAAEYAEQVEWDVFEARVWQYVADWTGWLLTKNRAPVARMHRPLCAHWSENWRMTVIGFLGRFTMPVALASVPAMDGRMDAHPFLLAWTQFEHALCTRALGEVAEDQRRAVATRLLSTCGVAVSKAPYDRSGRLGWTAPLPSVLLRAQYNAAPVRFLAQQLTQPAATQSMVSATDALELVLPDLHRTRLCTWLKTRARAAPAHAKPASDPRLANLGRAVWQDALALLVTPGGSAVTLGDLRRLRAMLDRAGASVPVLARMCAERERQARAERAEPRAATRAAEQRARAVALVDDIEDLFAAPDALEHLPPCLAAVVARARREGHLHDQERVLVGRTLAVWSGAEHRGSERTFAWLAGAAAPQFSANNKFTIQSALSSAAKWALANAATARPPSCQSIRAKPQTAQDCGQCPYADRGDVADSSAACSRALNIPFVIRSPHDALLYAAEKRADAVGGD